MRTNVNISGEEYYQLAQAIIKAEKTGVEDEILQKDSKDKIEKKPIKPKIM